MKRGEAGKKALADRFERAKAEGDLPAHVDTEGLMRVLIAMLQGISGPGQSGSDSRGASSPRRKRPRALAERLIYAGQKIFYRSV